MLFSNNITSGVRGYIGSQTSTTATSKTMLGVVKEVDRLQVLSKVIAHPYFHT